MTEKKYVPTEPGTYPYTIFGKKTHAEVYRDNHGLWVRVAGWPLAVTEAALRGTFHPGPLQPPEER